MTRRRWLRSSRELWKPIPLPADPSRQGPGGQVLTGQAMKETRGQANPAVLQQLLEDRLRRDA